MRAKTLFAAAFVSLMLIGGTAQAQPLRSPLGGLIGAQLLPPLILLKTVKFLLTGAPPASPVCRGFFCR